MSNRADDKISSLDTLLGKYGRSKTSTPLAQPEESSADDYGEQGSRDEYTSQFLREIKERAQILSRNAAKGRKAALQHVVSEDSHKTKATAGPTPLDLFMDVIRKADISDASQTEAPTPQASDENLTVYSNDYLLPTVISQDSAPWTTEEGDTLNTSQEYYQGLQSAPWATSTTESYDDDSDSTSEELIGSDGDNDDDQDIDGGCDDRSNPAQDSKHSKPDADVSSDFGLAPYAPSLTEVDGANEEGASINQDSQYWPRSQTSGLEDIGVMCYPGKADGRKSDIDEEIGEDEDDEEERGYNDDDNVVTSEDITSLPDQTSANVQTDITERLEDSEMIAERHAVPGDVRGSWTKDEVVDDARFGMRHDAEDDNEEVKKVVLADSDTADVSSSQDASVTGHPEEVDVQASRRKHREEVEGETKSDDVVRDLAEDPKALMLVSVKKPEDSNSDIVGSQVCAWNQAENDTAAENASSVLLELTSETELDADVQAKVSSFLDEMFGGEVLEERRAEDDDEDNEDVIQRSNEEFSPQIQKPLLESAIEIAEQVAGSGEDSERRNVEAVVASTKLETSIGSVDYFLLQSVQDDKGPIDETSLITRGEGTGSGTGEEKMKQEYLDNWTGSKNTNAKDETVQDWKIAEDADLLQPGFDVGQSNFKQTNSPRLRDTEHHPTVNQHSSTSKVTSQRNELDKRRDFLRAKTRQPVHVYSKPTRPNAHPKSQGLFTADLRREQYLTTETSSQAKRDWEQTRINTGDGRNWNLGGTTGPQNINRRVEHGKDPVETASYSTRPRHRPEQTAELQAQESPGNDSERTKAPGNVRSLIAKFNSGSAGASPLESPRSDRSFDWSFAFADGRQKPRDRLSSTGSSSNPDKKTNSPQLPFEKSSGGGSNDPQIIPWMQEVRERRRRREQAKVLGKLPR